MIPLGTIILFVASENCGIKLWWPRCMDTIHGTLFDGSMSNSYTIQVAVNLVCHCAGALFREQAASPTFSFARKYLWHEHGTTAAAGAARLDSSCLKLNSCSNTCFDIHVLLPFSATRSSTRGTSAEFTRISPKSPQQRPYVATTQFSVLGPDFYVAHDSVRRTDRQTNRRTERQTQTNIVGFTCK